MEPYTTPPAQDKLSVVARVRKAWTLAQRIAWSKKQCPTPGGWYPGRRRRHKQEIHIRSALTWLRGLLGTGRAWIGGEQLTWTAALARAEQARAQLGRAAPNPYALRELLERIVATGPGTGWAIRNGIPQDVRRPKHTPYWLPRRSDSQARKWTGHVERLQLALARAAALASELSPTLRTTPNQERHYGEQGSLGMEAPASYFEAVARRCLARSSGGA